MEWTERVKHLLRVLQYLRPYRNLALFSVIVTVLGSGIGLLTPWPLKLLVDNVIQRQPFPQALFWLPNLGSDPTALTILIVAGGLLLTLLSSALSVLNNYVHTKLQECMVLDLRSDLFQHAQRLSLAFHDRRRSGGLIFAINNQDRKSVV